MNFLVQTVDGKVVHDFAFALQQAQEYYKWYGRLYNKSLEIVYVNSDSKGNIDGCVKGFHFPPIREPSNFIPVGEVGFVSKFLLQYFPKAKEALRPLNIPEILFPFAGRPVMNCYNREDFGRFTEAIPDFRKKKPDIYRKSLDTIKDEFNGPVSYEYDGTDFRGCQISPVIDIVSEWRAFVFHGEILHVANYSGDCLVFPSAERIKDMVEAYGVEAPAAYTLDVAVTSDGKTVIIECHRFFSCGLYGFSDIAKYPKMLSQAWFQMKTMRNDLTTKR